MKLSEPSDDGVIEVKTKQKIARCHSFTSVSQRRERTFLVDLLCKMGRQTVSGLEIYVMTNLVILTSHVDTWSC